MKTGLDGKLAGFSLKDVEIRDTTKAYSGFLQVETLALRHRRYEGGWSSELTREVMHRPQGVGVLLYDPALDKVLLVEQFRVGCLHDAKGPWQLELVAGLLDEVDAGDDQVETAEQVARREVKEEAGIDLDKLLPICDYYNSPGSSSEKVALFCAGFNADRPEGIFGLANENEDIRTIIINREEANAAVKDGVINNAMGIIALQWLAMNLNTVSHALRSSR